MAAEPRSCRLPPVSMSESAEGGPMAQQGPSTVDRLFRVFLALVFVVMAVEVFLLARQNRELKALVSSVQLQIAASRDMAKPPLQAGEVVEPLDLTTMTGGASRLTYDDPRDTILLFFSPDCLTCEENLENWSRIRQALDPARARLVYVSTAEAHSTTRFASEHEIPEPMLVADQGQLGKYRVFRVPATIVVGSGGVVKNVWLGLLSEEAVATLTNARS